MWKSWGDKYEIIPYNHEKRPRKVTGVNIYVAILVILYVLSMALNTHLKPDASFYYYVPAIIALCSVAVCLGLFFLKWKKNDNEYDLALISASALFAFMAWMAFPDSVLY